ncbi:MAG: L-threonylcarbamoyladenylate synthase [Flavobacteriaceae bacterium]
MERRSKSAIMVDIRFPGDEGAVDAVANALRAGNLAVLPTETVYGIAADATNPRAVAALYAAKGRPSFNPLIAHVDSLEMAHKCGIFSDLAAQLAARFWPGPLTLVVPQSRDCPVAALATAGLDTIAIRLPAHPVMRAVIARLGRPVVAPSANLSGRLTATRLQDALGDLGETVAIGIDDGACRLGIESTIVACTGGAAKLLRPGALAPEDIEAVAGRVETASGISSGAPVAPGMLTSHYAPHAPVRLNARHAGENEAFVDFGGFYRHLAGQVKAYADLSPEGDVGEAAACLFETLRRMDAVKPSAIAVARIPNSGLGIAINDRLQRAAAPRPV